jgi:hypothetical protein
MERVAPAKGLYASDEPIRIGVSSCLLGEEVRFDGGHKRSEFLTETLGRFVEFVPVCPELEIGLGVPRESIRLVRGPDMLPLFDWSGTKPGSITPTRCTLTRNAALPRSAARNSPATC